MALWPAPGFRDDCGRTSSVLQSNLPLNLEFPSSLFVGRLMAVTAKLGSTLDFTFLSFFWCTVKARMRANTEHTTRRAGDKRGKRGKEKTVGNRDMRKI